MVLFLKLKNLLLKYLKDLYLAFIIFINDFCALPISAFRMHTFTPKKIWVWLMGLGMQTHKIQKVCVWNPKPIFWGNETQTYTTFCVLWVWVWVSYQNLLGLGYRFWIWNPYLNPKYKPKLYWVWMYVLMLFADDITTFISGKNIYDSNPLLTKWNFN